MLLGDDNEVLPKIVSYKHYIVASALQVIDNIGYYIKYQTMLCVLNC